MWGYICDFHFRLMSFCPCLDEKFFTTGSLYHRFRQMETNTHFLKNVRKEIMNFLKKIITLIFFACVFSYVHAQELSPEEKDILQLQDQRSLGSGRLGEYLSSKNENIRYRALIAFANIQEDSSARLIIPLLADRVPRVRAAAALALGYLSDSLAPHRIFAALQKEKDRETQKAFFDALGRCGDDKMLDSLTVNNMSEYSQEGLAISFVRFALRGIKSERLVWSCFGMLSDTSAAGTRDGFVRIMAFGPVRFNRSGDHETKRSSSADCRRSESGCAHEPCDPAWKNKS